MVALDGSGLQEAYLGSSPGGAGIEHVRRKKA